MNNRNMICNLEQMDHVPVIVNLIIILLRQLKN